LVCSSSSASSSNNNPSRTASTHRGTGRHHHHDGVATNTTTTPTVTTPTVATLQLAPTGAVYVCVVNGAGRALIPGVIYDAGQTIPHVRSSKLLVTLGNNSVTARANGKPLALAPSANAISFMVLPSGVRMLATGTGPNCG
jgi:hypothetical protein